MTIIIIIIMIMVSRIFVIYFCTYKNQYRNLPGVSEHVRSSAVKRPYLHAHHVFDCAVCPACSMSTHLYLLMSQRGRRRILLGDKVLNQSCFCVHWTPQSDGQPHPVVLRPGDSDKYHLWLLSDQLVSKHSDKERETLTISRCPFP
jgi:hypothetical protein